MLTWMPGLRGKHVLDPRLAVLTLTLSSSLFETGKYHDLLIRCNDEIFKVHRAVVSSASDVIEAAVDRWQKE